jgi:hypothetical protein
MINVKNLNITSDGKIQRISATFDEFDSEGKTIRANARISRVLTDDKAGKALSKEVNDVIDFITKAIEKES